MKNKVLITAGRPTSPWRFLIGAGRGIRTVTAAWLKANPRDRNVMPYEMVELRAHTDQPERGFALGRRS
jgi:hypothetical protein